MDTQPALCAFDLPDAAATRALGAALASVCRCGDVVALWGPLGAGKTTLVSGLAEALCGQVASSPTYTLVHVYDGGAVPVWHFDAYRLDHPDMIFEAGLDEALHSGITVIEWPERVIAHLPRRRLDIHLSAGQTGRHAVLAGGADWAERLRPLMNGDTTSS